MSISDPQSFNRYAYVGNDPVNFTDTSGLLKAAPRSTLPEEFVTVVGHYDPSISHNGGSVWDYPHSDHWGTDPYNTPDPAQDSGFNTGEVEFSEKQQKILATSYNRINQGDCKKFINDTLAKHKVGKDFDSLEKLLNRAKFSFYDTSTFLGGPDYSPSQLGLDTNGTLQVRGSFLDGASAVTAPDRVNVFLSSKAFDRPLTRYGGGRFADTPSYIVHELFHVAGIDPSIVDSQTLTNDIRTNCRLTGADPIILGH
jgi:hypothetical protein